MTSPLFNRRSSVVRTVKSVRPRLPSDDAIGDLSLKTMMEMFLGNFAMNRCAMAFLLTPIESAESKTRRMGLLNRDISSTIRSTTSIALSMFGMRPSANHSAKLPIPTLNAWTAVDRNCRSGSKGSISIQTPTPSRSTPSLNHCEARTVLPNPGGATT
ncbi:unannotated protein [freshwater metagenome]|uniref:Unannotated protein n=1 Tax=freshwater metagenome TaxID=449393 RepID=A0A6J6E656_9ZZZZ